MSEQRIPPNIARLLPSLQSGRVDFILAGSVAVQAWGVDVGTPGDLDIVPERSRGNLERLAAVLRSIEAKSWPITGRWIELVNGEFRWEAYQEDHPLYGTRIGHPDPDDISTVDSLFSTIHGELDIVPFISGTYEGLVERSHAMTVFDSPGVAVMSLEDLLARLTIPRREKDAERVRALREVQRRG